MSTSQDFCRHVCVMVQSFLWWDQASGTHRQAPPLNSVILNNWPFWTFLFLTQKLNAWLGKGGRNWTKRSQNSVTWSLLFHFKRFSEGLEFFAFTLTSGLTDLKSLLGVVRNTNPNCGHKLMGGENVFQVLARVGGAESRPYGSWPLDGSINSSDCIRSSWRALSVPPHPLAGRCSVAPIFFSCIDKSLHFWRLLVKKKNQARIWVLCQRTQN